ncbi:MAG: hypothetical protein M3277_06225 [Actinomycetota bacterium]|nr:hypothetical protein [Actinomycetota bacterium]
MVLTRRALSLVLLGALMSWLLPSTSTGAALAHCGADPTRIHAFHVETVWNKKVYERSEKAIVKVTITRPAHEDPFEMGIPIPPPISIPAEEGVVVTTALLTNTFPPPFGRGETDAEGKVTFKIPLKEVKPGPVDATTYASKWTNEGGCPDIEEWGYKPEPKAFVIT